MASLHRALPAAALVLRVLTLILLVISVAVIATAPKVYDPYHHYHFEEDPPYITFRDYYAYRYALSVGVIGCAYTLLVIPFVAINVARKKMTGGSEGGTVFLIFTDVVFSVLIATGAAAGLGLAAEIQRFGEKHWHSDWKKFYHYVDASCGSLLVATVCMVIIIMISVHSLTK